MDRLLSGATELHEKTLDREERDLEPGNRLAARTFEDEPTDIQEDNEYLPEDTLETPGPGTEADRMKHPLTFYEEDEEKDPAVTGTLIEEEFNENSFEATYEFRTNEDYTEETPLISHLEPSNIEKLLEKDRQDLDVTVSRIGNGMMVTAQYDNPASATEAVYKVNQVVEAFDEIADETPQ